MLNRINYLCNDAFTNFFIMKFIFVIQGDGRGHMTQAIALAGMLRRNGHEVVEILLGKSKSREVPAFFKNKIDAPIHPFDTFSFVFDKQNRNVDMFRTGTYNLNPRSLGKYKKSLRLIRERIETVRPDVVINFYEILLGFCQKKLSKITRFICVGHQFIIQHPDFTHARGYKNGMEFLRLSTWFTNRGAGKTLALSFYPLSDFTKKNLKVVPPLLRKEVLDLTPEAGDYLLGYMVNQGYESEIRAWHKQNPEVKIRFFWDKKEAPKEWKVDETFTLYTIDDEKFVTNMAGCRGYITTAGFESVCEALYLDKPLMLIPAHIEQEVNAADASTYCGCPVANNFDLSRLIEYVEQREPSDGSFKKWVDSAEETFLKELTSD